MTRTFWLLVLYGARRLCPVLAQILWPTKFPARCHVLLESGRDDATYVGESGGRHCDGFPGDSVGDICCSV